MGADPLTLAQDGTPADFSADDFAALEAGLARRDVREALVARLRLDEVLGAALGSSRVDVDAVVERARFGQGGRAVPLVVIGIVATAMLATAVVVAGSRQQRSRSAAREVGPSPSAADDVRRAVEAMPGAESVTPVPETVEAPAPLSAPAPVRNAATESAPAPVPPVSDLAAVVPPVVDRRAEPVAPESVDPFERPDAKTPPPDARALAEWFEPVTGGIVDQPHENRPHGRIDGVMRLKPALPDGGALRLAAVDYGGLRIHLWHGTTGVTFDAYGGLGPWAAFTTTRSADEPLPSGLALADRDAGRTGRTNPQAGGGIEIRYADGRVTLVRGDVPIVSAVLTGPPEAVVFEGQATLRELAVTRARPLPESLAAGGGEPRVMQTSTEQWLRPAAAPAAFDVAADGAVTLAVENNQQPAWAVLPVTGGSLRRIELLVDRPQAGTGICIADAGGTPRHVLLFMSSTKVPGRLQLERRGAGDNTIEIGDDPLGRPLPLVDGAEPVWMRLTSCGGQIRVETSRDGVDWTLALDPLAGFPPLEAIGLYATAHVTPRTLRVTAMRTAGFSMLESLAPESLRGLALEMPGNQPLVNWLAAVDAVQPPQLDRPVWRRGCALGQLARNCNPDLAVDLLLMLWRDSLEMPLAADERWQLVDEIMTLAPAWNNAAAAERCLAAYEQLGERLADEGLVRCYSEIAPRQMAAPLATSHGSRVFPEPLARREALAMALAGDTQALAVLGQRLAFFNLGVRPANEPFFGWLQALARAGQSELTLAAEWRHPLAIDAGKEAAALRAEFDAALDSEAWSDACQLVAAAVASRTVDLLPAHDDPGLMVSLAVAVREAQRRVPRFLEAMRDDLAAAGMLRARQAIDAGDATAVAAVTVQFMGTPAAAVAHGWLGDRGLSAGAFRPALEHYSAAVTAIPASERQRLVEATALARELAAAGTRLPLEPRVPARRSYVLTPRARLEGDVGGNPGGILPEYQRGGVAWLPSVDWVARQVAIVPLDDRLLVANRFQLASHDRNSGAVQWRAGLGGDAGPTHEWPGQPMKPAVSPTHAFVRRLKNAGPTLAAIRLQDGGVAWETPLQADRWIISDPVVVSGTVLVCTATKIEDGFTLALEALDERTGAVAWQRRLVHLGPGWWRQRTCQVTAIDDALVIAVGGGVVCCDVEGTVRWIRRDVWVPPAVEEFWVHQAHAAPLVHDGRLFVAQPGVPCLAALDPDSGAAIWRAAEPCLRRIIGGVGNTIVAERSTRSDDRPVELVGFDSRSGAVTWRFGGDLLDGAVAAGGGILAALRVPVEGTSGKAPALVWLDAATGQPGPRVVLAAGVDPQPFLGPIVTQGDRVWGLFGRGGADPARDLVELVPQ